MLDSFIVILWVLLIQLVLLIYTTVMDWRIYSKAGQPGYIAIIPVYGAYVRFKIAFGNSDYFKAYTILVIIDMLLFMAGEYVSSILLTIASSILYVICNVKLSRAFGKRGRFNVGVALIPYIFLGILAFGDAEYEGPQ